MTSISTTALEYIEISSDEESLEDFESSNGLNITSAKELFDKFIHQCALSGVREDNINYVSSIFENASGKFIANQSFLSFLEGANRELKNGNAGHVLAEVGQCVCSESIPGSKGLGRCTDLPGASFNGDNADDKNLDAQLEAAKEKILELILKARNTQTGLKGDTPGITPRKPIDTIKPNSEISSRIHSSVPSQHKQNVNLPNKVQEQAINSEISNAMEHTDLVHVMANTDVGEKYRIVDKKANETQSTECEKTSTVTSNYNIEAPSSTVTVGACQNDDSNDDDVIIISVKHHDNQAAKSSQRTKLKPRTSNEKSEKNIALTIKSLKKRLKFYDSEIKRLMQAELTLDEMDNADSSYIKECKLKSNYSRLYKKLCKLQGQKESYEDEQFLRIKIEGCPYPEINREAESFVKSRKRFPDFFEIKNVVGTASKKYKIGLKPYEENNIAKEVFTEMGDKLQRKRKKEFSRLSGNFLTDKVKQEEDPALKDSDLKKKLKTNKKISKSRTEEVFQHFSRMEYEGFDSDDEEIEKAVIETQKKVAAVSPGLTTRSHGEKTMKKRKFVDEYIERSPATLTVIDKVPEGMVDVSLGDAEWEGNSCIPKYLPNLKRKREMPDVKQHENLKINGHVSSEKETRNDEFSRFETNCTNHENVVNGHYSSKTGHHRKEQSDNEISGSCLSARTKSTEMLGLEGKNPRRVKPTLIGSGTDSKIAESDKEKRDIISSKLSAVVTDKNDLSSVIVIDSDED